MHTSYYLNQLDRRTIVNRYGVETVVNQSPLEETLYSHCDKLAGNDITHPHQANNVEDLLPQKAIEKSTYCGPHDTNEIEWETLKIKESLGPYDMTKAMYV